MENNEKKSDLDAVDATGLIEKLKANEEGLRNLKLALLNLSIDGTSFNYYTDREGGLYLSTDESFYRNWNSSVVDKAIRWGNSTPPSLDISLEGGEIKEITSFVDGGFKYGQWQGSGEKVITKMYIVAEKYIGKKVDKELLLKLNEDMKSAYYDQFLENAKDLY